jgi:hypothetical protein
MWIKLKKGKIWWNGRGLKSDFGCGLMDFDFE